MKQHFVVPQTDESVQTFGEGSLIGGKFKLEEKIGQGSFGLIFKCIHVETQEVLAVKLEKRNQTHSSMLVREIKVMMEMKNDKGFAKMHAYGKDDDYNYVVMSYLGRNMDSLLKKCGGSFTMPTVINVADQMITRLEALHEKNLIHRDIKPENYVIGYGSHFTIVHLLDFGLAKYYKDSEGSHIPFVGKKGMIGTARYASVNAHMGNEQSRRDDLEALGYVLIYFAKGRLPWQSINAETKEEKYEKIKQMKIQLSPDSLCENLPFEFVSYFKHVKTLTFEEKPNYAMLKKLFLQMPLDKKHENILNALDWESLPDYRQRKKYQTVAIPYSSASRTQLPTSNIPTKNKITGPTGEDLKQTQDSPQLQKQQQQQKNVQPQNKMSANIIPPVSPQLEKADSSPSQQQQMSQSLKLKQQQLLNQQPQKLQNESLEDPSQPGIPRQEIMSNIPVSNYLNVPNNDKITNSNASHSLNSANSGGTSKMNNYLWSESEDITNEESIQVSELITKEKQLLHPHTIFQDIRFKMQNSNQSKAMTDPVQELEDGSSSVYSPGQIQKHKTIFTNTELKKSSSLIEENITDQHTENNKDIKIFQVKSAFHFNSK